MSKNNPLNCYLKEIKDKFHNSCYRTVHKVYNCLKIPNIWKSPAFIFNVNEQRPKQGVWIKHGCRLAAHFLQNDNILNTYSTKSKIFVNCAHLISRKHRLKRTHTHTHKRMQITHKHIQITIGYIKLIFWARQPPHFI